MAPLASVRRAVSRLGRQRAPRLPARGFAPGPAAAVLDGLDDESVDWINNALPWACFTSDASGRRMGKAAWAGKRTEVQEIPDRRIRLLDDRFGLRGSSVLEVGCFEGVHTIGLALMGARVLAIDARVENAVKTLVRCWAYDCDADVRVVDVEHRSLPLAELRRDLVHHVGVLYHLTDPVLHVLSLGELAHRGLMLDTHVAAPENATSQYEVAGSVYRYMRYTEQGRADPFSGTRDHAKWLTLDDLIAVLRAAGFADVELVEQRNERNGDRVLLFASR